MKTDENSNTKKSMYGEGDKSPLEQEDVAKSPKEQEDIAKSPLEQEDIAKSPLE